MELSIMERKVYWVGKNKDFANFLFWLNNKFGEELVASVNAGGGHE
jgi:hypothetical protein